MNNIRLSEVKILASFKKHKPSSEKIENVIRYANEHKKVDKPIILNNGVLVDGYVRYIVAKMKGWKTIPYVELKDMEYIVGKFDNNSKEFVWKNNKRINIEVGDKVVVWITNSKGENKKVYTTVVNTFKSDSLDLYKKHKSVVRKLKNK